MIYFCLHTYIHRILLIIIVNQAEKFYENQRTETSSYQLQMATKAISYITLMMTNEMERCKERIQYWPPSYSQNSRSFQLPRQLPKHNCLGTTGQTVSITMIMTMMINNTKCRRTIHYLWQGREEEKLQKIARFFVGTPLPLHQGVSYKNRQDL